MASAVGSFLTNFSSAYQGAKGRAEDKAEREADRAALAEWRSFAREQGQSDRNYRDEELAYRRSVSSGAAEPMRVSDPANTTMPAHQRAFLNAVSDGESGGAYDVRYSPKGGVTFDAATNRHPRIFEAGPAGPSSAAGRYQFTWTTWRDIAGADTPFSAENQDQYAWNLATRDYRARTGRDLDADLQSGGITSEMMTALAPTWAAFGNKGRHNRYVATYNDSLGRYTQTAPTEEPAPAPRGLSFGLPAADPLSITSGGVMSRRSIN